MTDQTLDTAGLTEIWRARLTQAPAAPQLQTAPARLRLLQLRALLTRLEGLPTPVAQRLHQRMEQLWRGSSDDAETPGIGALTAEATVPSPSTSPAPGQGTPAAQRSAPDWLQGTGRWLAGRAAARRPAAPAPPATPVAATPLGQLTETLQRARQAKATPALQLPGGDSRELASVQRFRDTWDQHQAERQVSQSLDRLPDNLGPFNSQMQVVQALALMRELSPAYLRHFVQQIESCMWLDALNARMPLKARGPQTSGKVSGKRTGKGGGPPSAPKK